MNFNMCSSGARSGNMEKCSEAPQTSRTMARDETVMSAYGFCITTNIGPENFQNSLACTRHCNFSALDLASDDLTMKTFVASFDIKSPEWN